MSLKPILDAIHIKRVGDRKLPSGLILPGNPGHDQSVVIGKVVGVGDGVYDFGKIVEITQVKVGDYIYVQEYTLRPVEQDEEGEWIWIVPLKAVMGVADKVKGLK